MVGATDVGIPLSELKPFTKIQGGSHHHMEVQVFEHAIVEMDLDAKTDTGASYIKRLDTGLAYLETLGAPAPRVGAPTPIWGISPGVDAPVLAAPVTGTPLLQIGLNFPLTLDGAYHWIKGILCIGSAGGTANRSGTGWIAADERPSSTGNRQSHLVIFCAALPPLWTASDRSGQPCRRGDLRCNPESLLPSINVPKKFYMASSVKVPIMLVAPGPAGGGGA